jgi:hypothetical protein
MTEVGPSQPRRSEPELVHGCTVCDVADLAQARVLGRSFLHCHPGSSFTVLVLDHPAARRAEDPEGLELWTRRDLATGSRPLATIIPADDSVGAERAAWPWLASSLLDLGRSPLVLIDRSILVLRALTPLVEAAERSGAAFVPRLIDPSVAHHNHRATAEVLMAGIIDPGLAALVDGIGSRAWVTWWKSLEPCTDGGQRAFDLAPGFGHAVVRDPGIGLSRWNLHERRVQRGPDGPTAGGAPLRTVSFEGLISDDRLRWSDRPGTPTPTYELGEPLYELASEYLARLAAAARRSS